MKRWLFKEPSPLAAPLVEQLGLTPLIASLLINRGIQTPEAAHAFLHHTLKDLPSPFLLKDMDRAVERIREAITRKEKIVVYGDYDVDGTTGTSLLCLFFREIGYPIEFYIPHRMEEGYSLNVPALKKIKEGGATVLITVDNGIASFKEVEAALELGIDVIVTDHHEVQGKLPPAFAVLNPKRSDCIYPAKQICGTGVAFNLLMALRSKLRESGYFVSHPEPDLREYLDLVALATVADVVPLVGVNRILVKYGLKQMAHTKWVGLKVLIEVAQIKGELSAYHLGFAIGPRVNACGRLYDAGLGVKLLTTTDQEQATLLALQLNKANQERQKIELDILTQAIKKIEGDEKNNSFLSQVIYDPAWHPGVIGIVASRLAERFHKPTIVLGKDGETGVKGSARTYGGLHLVEALSDCRNHLGKFGGHVAAAGLALEEKNLLAFQAAFEEAVRKRITPDDCLPRLHIDSSLDLALLNMDLAKELSLLEPYGLGNPEPLFVTEKALPLSLRIVGEKHLKFFLSQGQSQVEAMAFGMGGQIGAFNGEKSVAYTVKTNEFRGSKNLVLHVKDVY